LEVIYEFESVHPNIATLVQSLNLGGRNGVLTAINWFFQNEDFGIILEEDLEISSDVFEFVANFRQFIMQKEFFAICLFNPILDMDSNFVLNHWIPWGWATSRFNWKSLGIEIGKVGTTQLRYKQNGPMSRVFVRYYINSLLKMIRNETISTWDVEVHAIHIARNLQSIFPKKTLSKHVGYGSMATHAGAIDWWQHLSLGQIESTELLGQSDKTNRAFECIWRMSFRGFLGAIVARLKSKLRFQKS
jgi:hypothetical protein